MRCSVLRCIDTVSSASTGFAREWVAPSLIASTAEAILEWPVSTTILLRGSAAFRRETRDSPEPSGSLRSTAAYSGQATVHGRYYSQVVFPVKYRRAVGWKSGRNYCGDGWETRWMGRSGEMRSQSRQAERGAASAKVVLIFRALGAV